MNALNNQELTTIKSRLSEFISMEIENAFHQAEAIIEKMIIEKSSDIRKSGTATVKTPIIESPLLTVNEAVKYLRISRDKLYKIKSLGKLKEVKQGARTLFRKTSLDEYIESCEQ